MLSAVRWKSFPKKQCRFQEISQLCISGDIKWMNCQVIFLQKVWLPPRLSDSKLAMVMCIILLSAIEYLEKQKVHVISVIIIEIFFLSDIAGTLSSLAIETLAPLKKLKWLDLHGNQIKDLKKSQFKGLRDVESLDLSHNLIDKIDSSHLGDLTKMGWCNLSHNAIADLKR